MSTGCTWHFLLPSGRVTQGDLLQVADLLGARGLLPRYGPQDSIWAVTSDGLRTLAFEDVSSASSLLTTNGGLISFAGRHDVDELSLSVHHANGILTTELRGFGDSPAFDEVQLDISTLSASERGRAWAVFDADAHLAGDLLHAEFAWCGDEEALESAGQVHVHQDLAGGHLPAPPGTAMAVPTDSPLSAQLLDLAETDKRVLSQRHGWWELRAESGLCPTRVRRSNRGL